MRMINTKNQFSQQIFFLTKFKGEDKCNEKWII